MTLLNPARAAVFLGISEAELRGLHKKRCGPAYYATPRRRYLESELARWKERIQAGPIPVPTIDPVVRMLVDEMIGAAVKERPGWIYFLRAEGIGTIKIGFGRNLPQRIADVRGVSPVWLDFLGAISGTMAGETKLHRFFCRFRLHSEWFTPDPSLLQFIDASTPRFWTRIIAKYPECAAAQRPILQSVSPIAWHAALAAERSA